MCERQSKEGQEAAIMDEIEFQALRSGMLNEEAAMEAMKGESESFVEFTMAHPELIGGPFWPEEAWLTTRKRYKKQLTDLPMSEEEAEQKIDEASEGIKLV